MSATGKSPASHGARYFIAGILVSSVCATMLGVLLVMYVRGSWGEQPIWVENTMRFVASLPMIALCVMLFLRHRRGRSVGVGSFALGLFVAPALVVGAVVWALPAVPNDYAKHALPFDSVLWLNQEQSEYDIIWPPRLCMVRDLLSSGTLLGLHREQVVELLGAPATHWPSSGNIGVGIHYELGPGDGFDGLEVDWLRINFDADGVVEDASVYNR